MMYASAVSLSDLRKQLRGTLESESFCLVRASFERSGVGVVQSLKVRKIIPIFGSYHLTWDLTVKSPETHGVLIQWFHKDNEYAESEVAADANIDDVADVQAQYFRRRILPVADSLLTVEALRSLKLGLSDSVSVQRLVG
jgi:hypothetical protein